MSIPFPVSRKSSMSLHVCGPEGRFSLHSSFVVGKAGED